MAVKPNVLFVTVAKVLLLSIMMFPEPLATLKVFNALPVMDRVV